MWCLYPVKPDNVAGLLRCVVDSIDHIHVYFICTNTVRTFVRVGVVSPPEKNVNVSKIIIGGLLSFVVNFINHIHMYVRI